MQDLELNNPVGSKESEEQFLCRKCGLCCDGTLFNRVRLVDEDFLYMKSINPGAEDEDVKREFIQPCRYHVDNKCSIYTEWRPRTCTRYICKVLKRFRNNELTFLQANEMIDKAISLAKRVRSEIFPFVNNHRRALSILFDEYISTQSVPNQSVMLDYGVLRFRLKQDFEKNRDEQKAANDTAQSRKAS